MKRLLMVGVLLLLTMAAVSAIHVDGELQPVGPVLATTIRGSEAWYAHPLLAARAGDAKAVYVVAPALPDGGTFSAIRIDAVSGEQTAATVTLDPSSPFRVFAPAGARVALRGLRFARPALHLLTYPEGKGPGIHRVDSATGHLTVMAGERSLLTRNVFNSSSTPELLSLVSEDPYGRWLAALTRADGGWNLFLFTHSRVEES